jgi:hypothetical protein
MKGRSPNHRRGRRPARSLTHQRPPSPQAAGETSPARSQQKSGGCGQDYRPCCRCSGSCVGCTGWADCAAGCVSGSQENQCHSTNCRSLERKSMPLLAAKIIEERRAVQEQLSKLDRGRCGRNVRQRCSRRPTGCSRPEISQSGGPGGNLGRTRAEAALACDGA